MSRSKELGYEEVDSDGVLFVFKSDFGFLVSLKELVQTDPIAIAEKVYENDPESIRNVLVTSFVSEADCDADSLSSDAKREIIEGFITKHGLQECSILAQHMLSYAMIGTIKKKRIDQNQTIGSMISGLLFSRWKNFKNHALLWVYIAAISGIFVCASSKLYMPLIALN